MRMVVRSMQACEARGCVEVTPGMADGTVSTVKMDGSGWSNDTALIGQKDLRSYL